MKLVRALAARLRTLVDIDDVLVVAGIGMIGAGIWFIYWPAALIVMGVMSFIMGVMGSRTRRRSGKNS